MSWEDDDDSFYASINWEAQEAKAMQARQQQTAGSRPAVPQRSGGTLPACQAVAAAAGPPGGLRPGPAANAPPAAANAAPGNAAPAPISTLRSLFWNGGAGSAASRPQQQQQQQQQQQGFVEQQGCVGPGGQPPPGWQQAGPPQQLGQQRQQPFPWQQAEPAHQQQQQQQQGMGPYGGAPQPQGMPPNPPHQVRNSGGGAQQQQQPGYRQQGPQQPYSSAAPGPPPPYQNQQQRSGPGSGGSMPGGQQSGPMPAGGQWQGNPSGVTAQPSMQQGVPQRVSGGQQGPSSGSGQGPLMCGQLSLGHDKQLQLQIGHHDAVKAVLTRLRCGWDPKARVWRFPIADHDRVLEALQKVRGVRVQVEPLHHVPMTIIQASLTCPDDTNRYVHIPSNLEEQLMPFQREGVKFALKHGGRALIGDEMGLGKTVQAIAVAAAYRDEWPVLIIAPSSLREQWADALHRWLGVTEDHIHVVHSNKDAANIPARLHFLIASYNFVSKMDLDKKYKMVILDESHYIKDHQAQRTKATVPLLKSAKRVILLTGTPALNKPKEIFQQLAALVPSANLKMKHFGERYCAGSKFDKYGGACNLSELNALLKGTVMVRRLKNDVLTQLPKKRRQQVYLTLDGDAKRQLQSLQSQLDAVKAVFASMAKQAVASGGAVGAGGGRMEENKAIMEMYRKTAELKCGPVEEYVQLLLEAGQKFLLFAHHTTLLDAVEHSCNKKKAKYIRIDGKTPASERQNLVNRFQENEDVKVAILSIRAAGVGLTLTSASTVVFAEMSWTPGEIIQAEDRAHRIGQASSVNVYFLHVRNSIDDIIWQSVQNKLENVGQALDGQDQSMEVAAVRHMPERGQRALDGMLSLAAPPTQQFQQQQQQARLASGRIKSPHKSASAGQQPTLHAFFHGKAPAQPPKQQQQQQPQLQQQQLLRAGAPAPQSVQSYGGVREPAGQPHAGQSALGPIRPPPQAELGHCQPAWHGQQLPGMDPMHQGQPPAQQQQQQQQPVMALDNQAAAGQARGLVPLHAPSMHANTAGGAPPTAQHGHHAAAWEGDPAMGGRPSPRAAAAPAGQAAGPLPGGNAGPSAQGKWGQFVPQQGQEAPAGRPGGGWQAEGQENGTGPAGGSIGGPDGGKGGTYRQMAGAKRSYMNMMQHQ